MTTDDRDESVFVVVSCIFSYLFATSSSSLHLHHPFISLMNMRSVENNGEYASLVVKEGMFPCLVVQERIAFHL